MNQLISIITPCKNAGNWLRLCYQSIQEQSYSQWEWIVIDDHSSDNSYQLLTDISEEDQRVQIAKNTEQGIIPALTLALELSHGSIITRMDADDLMPPLRLQMMTDQLETAPKNTVVTGLVSYFSDEAVSEGYKNYESWLNEVNLKEQQWPNVYRECVIASPNWMMRTNELRSIGGFADLIYPEDYDLVFKWYQHKFSISSIEQVTLLWREHSLRTSRNSKYYQQKAFFRLKLKKFVELDYHQGPLVIWGNNVKSKLTARILDKLGIAFILQDITEYKMISKLVSPQLLIAVYPDVQQRNEITSYLYSISMKEGLHWWWL